MKEFIEKQTNVVEEKIKVTSLEIIVTGTKDKPYFQIKYKEVGKEDYNIGYGSYDLNNVFNWKEECFEIVNQLAEEYNNGWIPCEKELPSQPKENPVYDNKPLELYLVSDNISNYPYRAFWNGKYWTDGFSNVEVIAWQPLPAPYQPKGE